MHPPPRTIGVPAVEGQMSVGPFDVVGRDAAFTRLVAGQQARVTRLAARLLGWSSDVDDIVQTVFLKAWKSMPAFRGEAQLETWLMRIAINVCRSHRRRRQSWWTWWSSETGSSAPGAESAVPAEPPDLSPDASQPTCDAETFAEVRDAVRRLSPADREVIVLRYLEDIPPDELAALLGISRNALDVRLNRARGRLRTMLAARLEDTP